MSKLFPVEIQNRPELNLRQGIKSSLNKWRELITSLYLVYKFKGDNQTGNTYCKEIRENNKTVLTLDDSFSEWLQTNYSSINNIRNSVANCPLFRAQMEPLQVGIELFLKLGSVEFVNTSLSDSIERTGGNRFAKKINFSTNMRIIADAIASYEPHVQESFFDSWLNGQDDNIVSPRIKNLLIVFTEECQFKLRTENGEIFFQQDGVYKGLNNATNTVISSDIHESVGPFRILKSYVNEGMHPYIQDSDDGFKVRPEENGFAEYANMVETTLALLPKRTVVYHETKSQEVKCQNSSSSDARQLITYGAPGTGKSYKIKGETAGKKVFRTTFHPDSDYATFVGAYKPIMEDVERTALIGDKLKMADVTAVGEEFRKEKVIAYSFVEQVFTKAYIEAWANQKKTAAGGEPEKVYLVIEEINRGNCAQIFGDLFQLLDRNDSGFSDYPIKPDSDFGKFIGEKLSKVGGIFDATRKEEINALYPEIEDGVNVIDAVMNGELLLLPDNLYIRATMNTSDQSLFPMDSAFKRRWDWVYVPIKNMNLGWKIKFGDCEKEWWKFLVAINKIVKGVTNSADKQLGYFFVKAKDSVIDEKMFVNKVAFYLWNDVFKDCELDYDAFKIPREGGEVDVLAFQDFFKDDGTIDEEVLKDFLTKLVPLPVPENGAAPQAGTVA